MLEAKLSEAAILKRLLDAIKELVTDANFECNEEGITLQAMDNSHVALVAVKLESTGFKKYRCDRPMPLGVNLTSLTKVLKCAKDDDTCTLKASDDGDILSFTYEARNTDRLAEYELKLMDIDSDTLGIPETEYDARVTMPSSEFGRIVRDLSMLGESVRIEVSKEGVRFASEGEAANGSVLLKSTEAPGGGSIKVKKEKTEDDDEAEENEVVDVDEEDEEEEEDGDKKKKKKAVKKEKVKKEKTDGEDVDMEEGDDDDDGEFKAEDGEDEDGEEEQDDEESDGKKRKRSSKAASKPAKKAKKASQKKSKKSGDDSEEEDDLPENAVRIELNSHVNLTFSLKYLVNFSKSASLSGVVQLMMSNDVPLLVSYEFGQGHIHYYLAPKIGDD
ncbi:proliferating cell nuclear antigen, N-terminal domain-containing protein [Irpex lacteus]|nr:proliferating cell nuclear antigen, N-terminal domain-containing protein [Irpex lacteus]